MTTTNFKNLHDRNNLLFIYYLTARKKFYEKLSFISNE